MHARGVMQRRVRVHGVGVASLPVGHEGPRGTQRPAMDLAGWHG